MGTALGHCARTGLWPGSAVRGARAGCSPLSALVPGLGPLERPAGSAHRPVATGLNLWFSPGAGKPGLAVKPVLLRVSWVHVSVLGAGRGKDGEGVPGSPLPGSEQSSFQTELGCQGSFCSRGEMTAPIPILPSAGSPRP